MRLGRSQPLGTALSQLQCNTCTCNKSLCLPREQVSMLLRSCLPIPKYGLPPLSTPMAKGQWNQTRQFRQLYPTIWLLPQHLVINVCWFHSRLYFRLSTRDWIVGPLLFLALNLFGQKGVLLFHYRSSCGSQASPRLHSLVLAREWMRPEFRLPFTQVHTLSEMTLRICGVCSFGEFLYESSTTWNSNDYKCCRVYARRLVLNIIIIMIIHYFVIMKV